MNDVDLSSTEDVEMRNALLKQAYTIENPNSRNRNSLLSFIKMNFLMYCFILAEFVAFVNLQQAIF